MKANSKIYVLSIAFDKELRAWLSFDLKNFKTGKGRFLINNINSRHNKNGGFQIA